MNTSSVYQDLPESSEAYLDEREDEGTADTETDPRQQLVETMNASTAILAEAHHAACRCHSAFKNTFPVLKQRMQKVTGGST